MKLLMGLAAALILLSAAILLPLPVRPNLDFQVLYQADLGLLRGIPVYDYTGQVNLVAQMANVGGDQVFVLPFPYPPWFALATAWLALVPINAAARAWFGLNLIMLGASLWLLTEGLPLRKRLALALPAIIFPPVLGSLFVGQYVFPVLLGAALMAWALRRGSGLPLALAAAVLTFKPHLGGVVLVMGVVYLWLRRDEVGRRGLLAILGTGMFLFAVGFLASPAWPAAYFHSLVSFQGIPGVQLCTQCVSLPVVIASAAADETGHGVIAAALLLVLATWVAGKWDRVTEFPSRLITTGLLITLLASPYLLNYDYVMLLVPLIVLAAEASAAAWVCLGLAYVIPMVSLALYGTAGNSALVVSTLILFLALVTVLSRPGNREAAQPAAAGDGGA